MGEPDDLNHRYCVLSLVISYLLFFLLPPCQGFAIIHSSQQLPQLQRQQSRQQSHLPTRRAKQIHVMFQLPPLVPPLPVPRVMVVT